MNGFEQIKSFYSWVFNNPDKVRPTHISLYLFLLNQNNRSMWVEWFKCPYDLAMQGACIGNKNTYYKCLDDLQFNGLIEYKKGINNFKSPLIKLIRLYESEPLTEQVTVPQSEPQTEKQTVPQSEPLSELLNKNTYKLITSNFKLVNDNITKWIENETPTADKFSFFNSMINLGAKKDLVNDWLKVRKTKKLTNTETAFNNLKIEFEKSGKEVNEILTKCITDSWGGFKASWNWQTNNQLNGGTEQIKRNRNRD